MIPVGAIRAAARGGDLDGARASLESALTGAHMEPELRVEAARLSAELGLVEVALRELRLALRDAPDHAEALSELAELHADRAEFEQEAACRQRLEAIGADADDGDLRLSDLHDAPGDEEPAEMDAGEALLQPDDADLVRFLHLFSGREDVHARQWYEPGRGGGYSPIRQPLTPGLLRAHVEGAVTLGVYPLRLDGTVTFFALDLDITKRAMERAHGDRSRTRRLRRMVNDVGLRMVRDARDMGLDLVLEDSGYKGRHLWGLLGGPLPADLVRRAAAAVGRSLRPPEPELSLEVFPKQSSVKAGGLGNLIKLPLGFHRRSNRRAMLLDPEGETIGDPWPFLRSVPRVSREQLLDVLADLRDTPAPARSEDAADESKRLDPPAPGPRPGPAPFTQVDFEARGEVATLLRGCPVLENLVRRGREDRRLDHDERVVMRHVLGHVPIGVAAFNYVLERCPEAPPDAFLQSPLRGNPISCPRIRKRIPHVTSAVPCNCEFPTRPDHYPTPLLHLDEARARGTLSAAGACTDGTVALPEEMARTWQHLLERRRRLDEELDDFRPRFLEALQTLPDRRLPVAHGFWQLMDDEGMAVIQWQAEGE